MSALQKSRVSQVTAKPAMSPLLQLRAQHAPGLFGFERLSYSRPSVLSLRDAATPVVFPERLARHFGRPLRLADRWLPVPIPDALARASGCGVSMDAGRALLRERLARLCAWLDAQLELAPCVTEQGASRLVTVFQCVGFRVDHVACRVSAARVDARGNARSLDIDVELRAPLCTAHWLCWVIEDLCLSAAAGQRTLFAAPGQAEAQDDWLIATAYGLLRSEPRFVWLRQIGLPRALGLDKTLSALAVRARPPRVWGQMPRSTYNLVWAHESRFRQVARENPQLLRLLECCLRDRVLPLKGDPVAELRDHFRRSGCSEAAWRYLHRHGDRLFGAACRMATNRHLSQVCVAYLLVLDRAGLPPPPPPSMAQAWFRCYVEHGRDRLLFYRHWCSVHPSVIRAVLLKADARRSSPELARFVDEAAGVLHWAIATAQALNKSQARAGWGWLRRHWQAWYAERERADALRYPDWGSPLPHTVIGRFGVWPLSNGAALVEEAFAMRNCLEIYAGRCAAGEMRLFSLRCAFTGKRVATLGLCRDRARKVWLVFDVRRFANCPPTPELLQLAQAVAQRCNPPVAALRAAAGDCNAGI